MTHVVIPLYERYTALDVIGVYQPLALTPGIDVLLVAERPGPVRDDCGMVSLVAESAFDDVVATDVLVAREDRGRSRLSPGPYRAGQADP